MKISVQREEFLKALQKVTNIIGSRTTLPILANVLIEADEGCLTLTTTDLELRMSTRVSADVEIPGKTTLPAKKLSGLVSKFRGASVSMSVNENFHAEIKCGTASITLLGLNPDDFPAQPSFDVLRTIRMKQSDLSGIIDRISYAASIEDSRKVLQGILFSLQEGKLTAVSTDGKRLALIEKILADGAEGADGDMIITAKAAAELKRIIDKDADMTIGVGENQVLFTLEKTMVYSKLIEGTYPNYRQVIPQSFKRSISIPCEPFIYAIEMLSVTLSDISSPNIRLTFKENTLLFEANSNIGEGSESIPIEYSGEEMSASFNPNFLLDPFKHLQLDAVQLKINDVVSPIAIESGDGFLYVIMPMRNK